MVAKRQHRRIAPVIVPPADHDEFLAAAVLYCLVEGCRWRGQSLSRHVREHGMTAREFKQRAGFNVSTGLVTEAVRERCRQASVDRDAIAKAALHRPSQAVLAAAGAAGNRAYYSIEAKGHLRKAAQRTRCWKRCTHCGQRFQGMASARFCDPLCQGRASEARRPARPSRKEWLRRWRVKHPERVRAHLHRQWLKQKRGDHDRA